MVTICEFPLDVDVLFDLMDISSRRNLSAATSFFLKNYVLSQRNFLFSSETKCKQKMNQNINTQ